MLGIFPLTYHILSLSIKIWHTEDVTRLNEYHVTLHDMTSPDKNCIICLNTCTWLQKLTFMSIVELNFLVDKATLMSFAEHVRKDDWLIIRVVKELNYLLDLLSYRAKKWIWMFWVSTNNWVGGNSPPKQPFGTFLC